MEMRRFGKTELQVSAIGFGCWESSGEYGEFDDQEIINAVHLALEMGVNLYDTAEAYGFGRSETLLGQALTDRRDQAVVVTKFGIYPQDAVHHRDSRPETAQAAIERSLKALNMDYVDVYLIHWPDRDFSFEDAMAKMEDIRAQGKARFVGVSNFRPEQIRQACKGGSVDVVQYGYHLFDRRLERFVFPTVAELDCGLMTYGSLAHGLLAGAYNRDTVFPANDWRARGKAFNLSLLSPDVLARNVDVVEDLKAIAADLGRTSAQLALRWVLSNQLVSTALVGFRNPGEVRANLEGLDWEMDADTGTRIQAVFDRHGVDTAPDAWVEEDGLGIPA